MRASAASCLHNLLQAAAQAHHASEAASAATTAGAEAAAKPGTLLAPTGFLSKELLRSVLQAAGDRCTSVRAAVRRVLLRVPVEDASQLKAAWQVSNSERVPLWATAWMIGFEIISVLL